MAATSANPLLARPLTRVSRDRSGREKSPDDQLGDLTLSADREGWQLGAEYRDVGSASVYATKARPDFERLIADLENDTFGAQVLMMWENSRGSREEDEWSRLIKLAARRGVRFWIDVRARLMDPADPHDRRDLMHAAADAAFETGLLSLRTRRGTKKAARAGLPHGRTPFGYQRRYDERTRQLLAQEEHPTEAPLVRELFERFDGGHSLRSIAADWEARGITGRSGKVLSGAGLRSLLRNPAFAGDRVHDPDRRSEQRQAPATRVAAVWPALVDREVFTRVQRKLNDPARRTSRPGGVRHLLSGVALCGKCGSTVRVRKSSTGDYRYACSGSGGCVRVPMEELELYVREAAVGYLGREDVYTAFRQPSDTVSADLEQVLAELEQARADVAEYEARADAGDLSPLEARAAAGKARKVGELEAREVELRKPVELAGLIEPGPDVAARWDAAVLDVQRATLRVIMRAEHVGVLKLLPVGRRRADPPPIRERVHLCRGEDCRTGPCAS